MPRAKSVVLSKDEKKALVNDLKLTAKACKNVISNLAHEGKTHDADLKAATQIHATAIKRNARSLERARKEYDKIMQALAAATA